MNFLFRTVALSTLLLTAAGVARADEGPSVGTTSPSSVTEASPVVRPSPVTASSDRAPVAAPALTSADAGPGAPAPTADRPGVTAVERRRTGAIVGGAVVLGTFYLGAAFVATTMSLVDTGMGSLYVPIAGPFVQVARNTVWDGTPLSTEGKAALVADGIGQVAGAALLAYGLFAKKTVLVRSDLAVTPLVTRSAGGIGVVGRF